MTAQPTFSLQPLEARRFLSATAAHIEDCPEVIEAQQGLQESIRELRHDRYQGRQELAAIRADIVEELRKLYEGDQGDEIREAVAPLYKELRAALRAQGAVLARLASFGVPKGVGLAQFSNPWTKGNYRNLCNKLAVDRSASVRK